MQIANVKSLDELVTIIVDVPIVDKEDVVWRTVDEMQ